MIDYKNKVVLVTGAASGIGAAIASALAGRGAQVICADRDVDGLNRIVEEIGGNAHALVCDLSDPTAAEKLIAQAHDIAGRLDLVCSNAGVGYGGRLAKTNYEDPALSRLFEINLFAGLKLAKAYVEQLKDSGATGRLLVTASENSLSVPSAVRTGRLALYGATKHALLIAMEWFRIEQEQGPLDVHVLMPGAVYTPLLATNLPDPSLAPPELELIMPEQCADIALKGMDLDLFYIPTQAHLLDDMHPRVNEIESALKALEIEITY
jgi:NAD(P)-dependent dehydrogenase (short-subunit alcohol dehydrogenase family)